MTPWRDRTEAILADLVSFDTVSAKSNLQLISYVADYLRGLGIDAHILTDATGQKANLWAQIGPSASGGIVLSGHTDVVPVEGQSWSTDPFVLTARDERLYGRGSTDMKGFIAAALATVPAMMTADLRRPFYLAFSYDEEIGCLGVPPMIADLIARTSPPPAMAIVGEPTGMKLANRHKGIAAHETRITGREAHSSQPHLGSNAIVAAASLIGCLQDMMQDIAKAGPQAEGFDPPYTTFNIGEISGGTAINIIARDCRFIWECRPVPGFVVEGLKQALDDYSARVLLPGMRVTAPQADIVTRLLHVAPPLMAEKGSEIEAIIRHLTGLNDSVAVSFATEAGLFQQAGISTVVFGPGHIAQAHQPDEFIERSQLKACTDFLARLVSWAAH